MAGQQATISQEEWDAVNQERNAPPAEIVEPPPQEPTLETDLAQEQEATPEPKASALDPEIAAKLSRLDELTALLPQVVNELKETKGRVGALQSQWDKTKQQLEQPTQKQVVAAAKDPDKWDALKKDFPEWGEAISEFVETRLGGLAPQAQGPSPEDIEKLVAERTAAATTQAVRQINEKLVTLKHPKWREKVKSPAFAEWLPTQPADIQALIGSEDGLDAIRVLDLFDEAAKAKPAEQQDRQRRLEAAANTGKPSAGGVTSKRFEDMTPKEQWDYLARERSKQAG